MSITVRALATALIVLRPGAKFNVHPDGSYDWLEDIANGGQTAPTQAEITAEVARQNHNIPIQEQIDRLEASISTPRRMREFMLGLNAKQGGGNPNANQSATMTEIESVEAQIDSLRATLQ